MIYILFTILVGLILFLDFHVSHRKKSHSRILTIIALALLPVISIWRIGVFESGDFSIHTQILMQFYAALKEGVIVPQWGANFCNNYGYPLFTYFYKFPYYVGSVFHLTGISFIDSMKLLFSLGYVCAGISMYTLLRHKFDQLSSFTGSALYLFAPYQLTGLHFKHALGELFGFIFVPLLFLYVEKFLNLPSKKNWLLIVIFMSVLILSHHIVPILALAVLIPYVVVRIYLNPIHIKRKLIFFGLAIFVSISVSIFHWWPLVMESYVIHQNTVPVYFEPMYQYFFSPWKFGLLFQGSHGELGRQLGYAHLIVIALSLFLIFNKKVKKDDRIMMKFYLGVIFFSFVMMQKITAPLWEHLPFLHNFQFSSRFLFLTTFIVPFLGAHVVMYRSYIFHKLDKRIVYLFIFLAIAYTQLNWRNRGMIPDITDTILRNQISERCDSLLTPAQVSVERFSKLIKDREKNVDVLSGRMKIISEEKLTHQHEIQVMVENEGILRINTTNVPRWRITDNNKVISRSYTSPFIELFLHKGFHTLHVSML